MMVEYAVEGSLYEYLQQRRPGDPRVSFTSTPAVTLNNTLSPHRLLALAAHVVSGLQHINRYKVGDHNCTSVYWESRTFVPTDIRSHAIFDRAGHSCSHQMTTPDIRAHIK